MPHYTLFPDYKIKQNILEVLNKNNETIITMFCGEIVDQFCNDRADFEIEGRHTNDGVPKTIEVAKLSTIPELLEWLAETGYNSPVETIKAIKEQCEALGLECEE